MSQFNIDEIVSYLCSKYHPKAILLHGSRARGDHFEQSDYDLTLITETPDQICPESYKGHALDLSGIAPTEFILTAGQTPIWPCLILFDDQEGCGKRLVEQTHKAFMKGPPPLAQKEIENRRNFLKRLMARMENRGEDPLVRYYYLGDFYPRSLRYWCELNQKWTMSAHLILPLIADQDPEFFKYLKGLWSENYKDAAKRVYEHLFEEI